MVLLATGCVSRKLLIRSQPAGATVTLDGQRLGDTPYAEEFLSYGTRELVLEAPGMEPRVELLELERPWWQWPVIDLFVELLWPFTVEDVHVYDLALVPEGAEPTTMEEARAAAERLRAHRERTQP